MKSLSSDFATLVSFDCIQTIYFFCSARENGLVQLTSGSLYIVGKQIRRGPRRGEISAAIILRNIFFIVTFILISLVTDLSSHVVGNCTNVSCEGGQHCSATKDNPDSLESKNNCNDNNDQGNDRVLIFHG